MERARDIYHRFCLIHQTQVAYIKWAKWELRQGQPALARKVFEDAISTLEEVSCPCSLLLW